MSEDKQQLEELYSKIHDEHLCVSTKSLSLDMGITRTAAGKLLEALPYYHPENQKEEDGVYEVTRCVIDESGDQYGEY